MRREDVRDAQRGARPEAFSMIALDEIVHEHVCPVCRCVSDVKRCLRFSNIFVNPWTQYAEEVSTYTTNGGSMNTVKYHAHLSMDATTGATRAPAQVAAAKSTASLWGRFVVFREAIRCPKTLNTLVGGIHSTACV